MHTSWTYLMTFACSSQKSFPPCSANASLPSYRYSRDLIVKGVSGYSILCAAQPTCDTVLQTSAHEPNLKLLR